MTTTRRWAWETLGRVFSEETTQSPSWAESIPEPGWHGLAGFALKQLVAPEFHQRLIAADMGHLPPPAVMEGLEGAFELNRMIHDDLQRMFQEICAICNAAGVAPVLLKGAIDVICAQDAVNRSRMVGDLDILVEAASVPDVFQALLDAGFHRDGADIREDLSQHLRAHHHCPPLWHSSAHQYVELHARLGSSASDLWLTNALIGALEPREIDGLAFKVPGPYARLLHNGAHHYLQNITHAGSAPSFRQLLDFARLAKIWAAAAPPGAIDAPCACREIGGALRVSAALSNRVFGGHIAHTLLEPPERRFVDLFWRRLEFPLLDRICASGAYLGRQANRTRNWRKLLSTRFYRVKLARLAVRWR